MDEEQRKRLFHQHTSILADALNRAYLAAGMAVATMSENEREFHVLSWMGHILPELETQAKALRDGEVLHTEQCRKEQQTQQDWMARWPTHCRSCHGYGQVTESYDPSAAGVSLSSGFIVNVDPCDDCTMQGLCPRCMQLGLTDEGNGRGPGIGYGPCTFCGWDYNDGGLPQWTCYCDQEKGEAL